MAKITIQEWLVELGIIKKGIHDHYHTRFTLNTSDLELVYSRLENQLENQVSPWVVTCDPANKTICNRKVTGTNVLGEELISVQSIYKFSMTEDNKVHVDLEYWNYENKNARFSVEVSSKKLYFNKKYGIIWSDK